jgi:hypothetical protein
MHALDPQERQDERNMMGPRTFRASATTEPPKQTARQRKSDLGNRPQMTLVLAVGVRARLSLSASVMVCARRSHRKALLPGLGGNEGRGQEPGEFLTAPPFSLGHCTVRLRAMGPPRAPSLSVAWA